MSSVVGFLDQTLGRSALGWAARIDSIEPVIVQLLVDDVIVAEATANVYRPDLIQAGFGTGHHGFSLEIPQVHSDGLRHSIAVTVVGTDFKLPSEVTEFQFPPKAVSQTHGERHNGSNRDQTRITSPANPSSISMTVIMPTYNRGPVMEATVEKFLPCLDRVGAEMIIIDDGSKDDTPERLARLSSKSTAIRYESVPNRGPGTARNRAASLANGDILVLVGDDVAPVDSDFLVNHQTGHARFGERGQAILGKITWPALNQFDVNFVMSHIQGEGEQQFGFRHLTAFSWCPWNLFYGSNISVKRSLVDNWIDEGFNSAFYLAAFEDAEFALRTLNKLKLTNEKLEIFYLPTAQLTHHHKYDVESFIRRQVSVGMMAVEFLKLHPGLESDLGLKELKQRLDVPTIDANFPVEHYLAIFEGLRSWAIVIENHYGLGSQNWHGDLLKAIFQLAYYEGYIRAQINTSINVGNGCRFILERIRLMLNRAVTSEILGSHNTFGLI